MAKDRARFCHHLSCHLSWHPHLVLWGEHFNSSKFEISPNTYICNANWCLSNFFSMQAFFPLPLECAWSIQTFSMSTVIHITVVDFTILSMQMVFLAPGLGWCKLERCTFKRSNLFSTNDLIYGLRSVSLLFCTSWSLESSSFAYWIWLTGLIEYQKKQQQLLNAHFENSLWRGLMLECDVGVMMVVVVVLECDV